MPFLSDHDSATTSAPKPVASVSPVADIDPNFVRGGSGPNGKTSLTVDEAGQQITRDGYTLNGMNVTDTPVNITYAFRATNGGAMPEDTGGFSTFNADQIAATELALAAWADVANVAFTRVGSGTSGTGAYSDDATMLFGNYATGMSSAAAFAYYPVDNNPSDIYSSDVWVNNSLDYNAKPQLLGYGQQALVHEIGHALGLEHPGDYNAGTGGNINYNDSATYYEDSRQYSVMSYFGESNTGAYYNGQYASAPLLDDIAAIQRLYGANMTTRAGDTVYGFNSTAGQSWYQANGINSHVIFAVWDAGGIDTFDFSGYYSASFIDLRATHFSNVGGLTGNVSIAEGVVIENAIGGWGNDTIVGNDANNVLEGRGGNDSLDGGAGSDTASYAHASRAVSVNLSLTFSQYVGGDEGGDTLINIENLIGSGYDDTLIGNSGNNRLDGGAGSDYAGWLSATAGVTVSLAIDGAQSVGGGQGTDTLVNIENLLGSSYNDTLTGNAANNILEGYGGNDTLNGGGGSDTAAYLFAGGGVTVDLSKTTAQAVGGSMGSDTLISIENLIGSYFNDTLTGNSGDNILEGAGGNDTLNGGAGYDTASYKKATGGVTVNLAVSGVQAIGGGMGNDTLVAIENVVGSDYDDVLSGNAGNNILNGGAGIDMASYSLAASGVTVDLSQTGAQVIGGGQGSDRFISIENVTGSDFDDKLTGSAGNNVFLGGAGNDIINGAGGVDTVSYTQATSGVTVSLSVLTSQFVGGGMGNDTLGNVEAIIGSAYNDNLTGNSGNNVFNGGSGDDSINGAGGIDAVTYELAYGSVTVDLTRTTAQAIGGGMGSDTLTSIENIVGSNWSDTLTGIATTTSLLGGFGDDKVIMSGKISASAHIDGGFGQDTLILKGDYSSGLILGATTITSFETIELVAGNDYNLTLNDAITALDQPELKISADKLGTGDNFLLDGSAETNASLVITAGGGKNTIRAGQADDHILMSHLMTTADAINGASGYDWLYLIGNYSTGLTFTATMMQNIESIYFAAGGNYNIKLADGNVAAGQQLQVYGNDLTSTDTFKVDGSSETDGSFNFVSMIANNTLKGGAQADTFYIQNGTSRGGVGNLNGGGGNDFFLISGDIIAGNSINGGAGLDAVNLSGYGASLTLVMTATTMTGIEDIGFNWGYANVTTHDATIAAGARLMIVSDRGLTLNGSAEKDGYFWASGSDYIDNIRSGAMSDLIMTFGGNDVLNGGGGADQMYGGAGNDTYYIDNAGDVVNEESGNLNTGERWDSGGIDTVISSIGYTLVQYVENLTLAGSAVINALGNALNNTLTGNGAVNRLNGGLGADTMIGGAGSDIYYVDNVGDKVIEVAKQGTDAVSSSVSFALGSQYIESLALTGTANINASGNALDNVLTGNSGNNVLNGGGGADKMSGGLGNDTYYIENTGDIITELKDGGTDTVSSSIGFALGTQYIEKLTLTGTANINASGNALDNILTGNSGNNLLSGGGGADKMLGGLGNDIYYVENVGDTITELSGAGTDTVISSISFSLGMQYIENLTLTGSANVNGSGNALDNILLGNTGANLLSGGGGADTLNGGIGDDTLTGGLGADIFSFGAGSGVDQITDFSAAQNDSLDLHAYNSATVIFTQIGADTIIDLGGGNTITILNAVKADVTNHISW